MSVKFVTPSLCDLTADLPTGAAYLIGHAFVLTHDDGSGTIGSVNFVGIRVWNGSAWGLATTNNPIHTSTIVADNSSTTVTITGNSIYQGSGAVTDPQISFGPGATSFISGDLGWTLITAAKSPLWQWLDSTSTIFQDLWSVQPDIGSDFGIFVVTQGSGVVGANLNLRAGYAAGGNNNGGTVQIQGGQLSGSPAVRGGVRLCVHQASVFGDTPLVEAAEVAAGRVVVSLVKQTAVTSTHVPSGDGIVYIGDCDTAPTSAPSGGGAVYYQSGVGLVHYGVAGTITTIGPT